ncbi:AAA-domain-containing protein [Hypoxylon sp. NC1633]|nr:AAA-domain-containing protein [Hypoxylon sp. NC1633]
MHTLSLRAFRSAALGLQKPHLATLPGRLFHASAVARAADDSNSGPRDDGNKPEKENGASDGDNTDENLFGENNATENGENQGRKRPSNGSLRSRALRNRKPEELPPVPVPKSFLSHALGRFENLEEKSELDHVYEREVRNSLKRDLLSTSRATLEKHSEALWNKTAWDEEDIREAREAIEAFGSGHDWESTRKRGDCILVAALWTAVAITRDAYGHSTAAELLEKSSASLPTLFSYAQYIAASDQSPSLAKYSSPTKSEWDYFQDDSFLETSFASYFKKDLIDEIVASVKTDILVQAPKNVKVADLRRPVTVINFPDYSGHSVPRQVVRHIASIFEADVLHLRACDIAHIVGSYVGQDAVRAPGAISQLGYKAAENSGRTTTHAVVEEQEEIEGFRMPFGIVMRDERLKKDNKRYLSQMDDFLNGPSRSKNDELWEDLKVNTALEELIHTPFSDSTEKRTLIVHIDDFNAINMDLECGSIIIGKIRKVVDGLWAEGREIVVIGTCSTKGAPKPYLNALRELESTEWVYTHRMAPEHTHSFRNHKRETWETMDYIRENEGNLAKMLLSMLEPPPESTITTTGDLGMCRIDREKLPKSWQHGVLPLVEVRRIATTIIGLSPSRADVFSTEAVEKAAAVINRVEELKENYRKIKVPEDKGGQRKDAKDLLDVRRSLNPSEENHEDRLESGLVNAEDIRTTFNDVHAPRDTIESVKMLTTLSLVRPEAFSYGVLATDRIPGCLLYGPPGTGKTLLAKAVARESGANMIEVSGASINNKYVGESEKNVRALFRLARRKEPMVIFIDEADALLGSRGRSNVGARRETINQFLREWDGLDDTKAFIMVATNRPFDLDEAVLRRLPRKLLIDLPLEADRAAILRIILKDEVLDPETVDLEDLARRTPMYSGSDLKNVCVAAAMAAVKEELEAEVEQQQRQQSQQQSQEQESEKNGSGEKEKGEKGEKEKKNRVLAGRHFDKALREIGASVSEDTATLTAIRKFDEKYGDGAAAAARRRGRKGMGFGVVAGVVDAQEARVRSGR